MASQNRRELMVFSQHRQDVLVASLQSHGTVAEFWLPTGIAALLQGAGDLLELLQCPDIVEAGILQTLSPHLMSQQCCVSCPGPGFVIFILSLLPAPRTQTAMSQRWEMVSGETQCGSTSNTDKTRSSFAEKNTSRRWQPQRTDNDRHGRRSPKGTAGHGRSKPPKRSSKIDHHGDCSQGRISIVLDPNCLNQI